MIYGISILVAVMAIILAPKMARRIFWAWLVFVGAVAGYEYWQVQEGQARVRGALQDTYWQWKFIGPTTPGAEASYKAAEKIADLYPLHWWENYFEKSALQDGVANQWLLAWDIHRKAELAAKSAGQEKARREALKAEQKARSSLIRVLSDPPGATVKIDDFACGKTPVDVEVGPGRSKVYVYKDGYSDFLDFAEVAPGRSVTVKVQLAPFPGKTAGIISQGLD